MIDTEEKASEEVEPYKEGKAGSWLWLPLPLAIVGYALAGPGHSILSGLTKIYLGALATGYLGLIELIVNGFILKQRSWIASIGWGPWFARVRVGSVAFFCRLIPLGTSLTWTGDPKNFPDNRVTWKTTVRQLTSATFWFCLACVIAGEAPAQLAREVIGVGASVQNLANLTIVHAIADSMAFLTVVGAVLTILMNLVIMKAQSSD